MLRANADREIFRESPARKIILQLENEFPPIGDRVSEVKITAIEFAK